MVLDLVRVTEPLTDVQPVFVFVLFDAEIGPARVLVPAGAQVDYEVTPLEYKNRYGLLVAIDGELVGWHCGERSHDPVLFERKSDAVRLAAARGAAQEGQK